MSNKSYLDRIKVQADEISELNHKIYNLQDQIEDLQSIIQSLRETKILKCQPMERLKEYPEQKEILVLLKTNKFECALWFYSESINEWVVVMLERDGLKLCCDDEMFKGWIDHEDLPKEIEVE